MVGFAGSVFLYYLKREKERDREEELMLMVGFAGNVFLYYLKREKDRQRRRANVDGGVCRQCLPVLLKERERQTEKKS